MARNTKTAKSQAAIAEILEQPYTRELRRNSDGTWFARIVELPGCMTEGKTQKAALENVEDAMRLWIEASLEDGHEIPAPSNDDRYSGKFMVRVPKPVHRELAIAADREGVSMNLYVASKLAAAVGARS